jgi:methyl-accepting chemotaxis protein
MKFIDLRISARLIFSFGLLSLFFVGLTAVAAFNMTGPNSDAIKYVVGLGLLALLASIALSWWVYRGISAPLHEANLIAKRMAAGDLSEPFEANAQGELGELQLALQEMSERMFKIVADVRNGTTAVASTSGMIATDNNALSGRTESQASSLEETASSMEELTSTVKQNADNAKQANKLVATAADSAVKGGQVVGQVVTTMASIKDSSRKIVDIISVIDAIAFQTNILALNAAVEAARAGEQGRGFAVVAAEVRTLAQRSAAAAKEIKELINDSVQKVDTGSHLVDDAGVAMDEIVASVKRVASLMSEIAAASSEQSAGIEEINQAVMQIDGMTQQNAALVEEASRTAAGLLDQAATLSQTVSIFNLGAREFGNADEAVEMVHRARAYMEQYGRDAIVEEVNKLGKSQFIDRDLYITVYGLNNLCLAHGTNRRLIGINWTQFKDPEGKLFCSEMAQIAKTAGSGWVDYKWNHPLTKELMGKMAYFERVDDVFLACGFFFKP